MITNTHKLKYCFPAMRDPQKQFFSPWIQCQIPWNLGSWNTHPQYMLYKIIYTYIYMTVCAYCDTYIYILLYISYYIHGIPIKWWVFHHQQTCLLSQFVLVKSPWRFPSPFEEPPIMAQKSYPLVV